MLHFTPGIMEQWNTGLFKSLKNFVYNLIESVTPVETGVQGVSNYLKSFQKLDWIPAFAGMTKYHIYEPFMVLSSFSFHHSIIPLFHNSFHRLPDSIFNSSSLKVATGGTSFISFPGI